MVIKKKKKPRGIKGHYSTHHVMRCPFTSCIPHLIHFHREKVTDLRGIFLIVAPHVPRHVSPAHSSSASGTCRPTATPTSSHTPSARQTQDALLKASIQGKIPAKQEQHVVHSKPHKWQVANSPGANISSSQGGSIGRLVEGSCSWESSSGFQSSERERLQQRGEGSEQDCSLQDVVMETYCCSHWGQGSTTTSTSVPYVAVLVHWFCKSYLHH